MLVSKPEVPSPGRPGRRDKSLPRIVLSGGRGVRNMTATYIEKW